MRPRPTRFVCLVTALLSAGFIGPSALADPLYTITDLGSGPITLTTATGGTTVLPAYDGISVGDYATSQFVSVSNRNASCAFSIDARHHVGV
jgi:hypothetical protein